MAPPPHAELPRLGSRPQDTEEKEPLDAPGFESGAFESLEKDFQEVRRRSRALLARRPLALRGARNELTGLRCF